MILIKITKETREPEVGEWYVDSYFKAVGKRDLIEDHIYEKDKALSLSVILDAPGMVDQRESEEMKFLDGFRYEDWLDEVSGCDSYPVSNSEEIFQWLHDQGKLGEEWVEWPYKFATHLESDKVELVLPNKINEKSLNCQKLECYQTHTDWQERLFNHMAQDHDINLTDTQIQDIYSCIVKFDPEKETRRFHEAPIIL